MRAVIWTVVGVLVVAAVAIFIYMRSQDKKVAAVPTAEQIKTEAARFAKKADDYAAEAKKLRDELGTGVDQAKKSSLARLDSLAAALKSGAARLTTLTGNKVVEFRSQLNDIQKEFASTRHELTGGTAQ